MSGDIAEAGESTNNKGDDELVATTIGALVAKEVDDPRPVGKTKYYTIKT